MTSQILFLCTGNTCRSQMAEAMAQQLIDQHGWPLTCHSAGIRATTGAPTTAEAIQVLTQHGIPWQGCSQMLSPGQLGQVDEVWVMTEEHQAYAAELSQSIPQHQRPRISLLATEEVPDPLGCGLDAYIELYEFLQMLLPQRLRELVAALQA